MKIAHSETTDWTPPRTLRGGVLQFKCLLDGEEESPNNFSLVLAHTDLTFKSPRHRHNFDQIRVSLQGPTNFGPRQNIEVGDVAYFPEGAYYGRQDQELTGQSSLAMVVQFGGASGNGYMSQRQLLAAQEAMQTAGSFEGGVYRRAAAAQGERKNQDAYEAVWEYHNGRPIEYVRPELVQPVQMQGGSLAWRDLEGSPGVSEKLLGDFPTQQVRIASIRLGEGARYTLPESGQPRVLFFMEGAGSVEPQWRWSPHTAVHLEAQESVKLRADQASEVLVLSLPHLEGAQK